MEITATIKLLPKEIEYLLLVYLNERFDESPPNPEDISEHILKEACFVIISKYGLRAGLSRSVEYLRPDFRFLRFDFQQQIKARVADLLLVAGKK
jgi:hypothetical protein